jgi:hypothetical protein
MNDSVDGQAQKISDQLARQRRSSLMSVCCAFSVLTFVVMVPPLNKLVGGLLINGSTFIIVSAVCLGAPALIGSLYFYFAVLIHLIRYRNMGATGKTIWGVCLLIGGTLTAIVYFLMVWSADDRS